MNAVKEKAYAKINLFLDVLSKRNDGFHEIKTVMHSVSLCDTVTVTLNSRGKRNIKLSIEGNKWLPTDGKNLVYIAADIFFKRSGIDADITINLEKKIPVAAGLAGGSTDAAATLRALNKLFRRPLTDKALYLIAEELGSDVPFCLYGGTALCLGRGDIIKRLPDSLRLHLVVAVGREHISTPSAYKRLDEIYSDFDGTVAYDSMPLYDALFDYISFIPGYPDKLFNVFESAVLPMCPVASEIKARLLEYGATCSLMSGSGPSVFGIFKDESTAIEAAKKLTEDMGVFAVYAQSV